MFDEDEFGRFDVGRQIGQAFENAAGRARARVGETARSVDKRLRGRPLTPGELGMIEAMFGTTRGIAFARVFPFNFWWPYPNDRAMTPNGSIYFPRHAYADDYSQATVSLPLRALFMHEATHLYQHYVLGMWLMVQAPFDRNYEYELVPGRKLADYGIEQMGQIVQDYYTISNGGRVAGKRYSPADYHDAVPVRAK